MKRFFRKAAIILLQIVAVMFAVEITARIIFPDIANNSLYLKRAYSRLLNSAVTFKPDSDNYSHKYGFTLSSNAENTRTSSEFTYTRKTNSAGFRTKEVQPGNADEYRIMLLGDSMMFGVGVEESDMISSLLEDHGEPGLSVYNYSVSGYNTVQELIVAKEHVDSLKPDHIILGFFIANDLIPNAIAFIDNEGNYSTSAEMKRKIKRNLKEHLGLFFESTALRIVALRAYIPRLRYQIATSDDVISKSYALLREFDNLANDRDIRFSVVIMHPRDSVQGGIVEDWSNSRHAGQLIYSFCMRDSIDVLNIIDYMNTAEHKNNYFFKEDGHPNKQGNAVIAEAIYKDLVAPHISQ